MTIERVTNDEASGTCLAGDHGTTNVGPILAKVNEIIDAVNNQETAIAAIQALVGIGTVRLTDEGGIAVKLTNKTGAASVKGTLVEASITTDGAVDIAAADALDPIGAMYEDGVADGDETWIVISGIADVLLKDGTASTREHWVGVSDVSGRADATAITPPGPVLAHFREIGHALESKGSGTDVLARIVLHFN
jgi:hypothetical protein